MGVVFSSRRRHTRYWRDWSSDVCSSDLGAVTTWDRMALVSEQTCATRTTGTLWCWGDNGNGAAGLGDTSDRNAPTQVGSATTWTKVSAANQVACGTRSDGTIWCWGYGAAGQLGGTVPGPAQVGAVTTWLQM